MLSERNRVRVPMKFHSGWRNCFFETELDAGQGYLIFTLVIICGSDRIRLVKKWTIFSPER